MHDGAMERVLDVIKKRGNRAREEREVNVLWALEIMNHRSCQCHDDSKKVIMLAYPHDATVVYEMLCRQSCSTGSRLFTENSSTQLNLNLAYSWWWSNQWLHHILSGAICSNTMKARQSTRDVSQHVQGRCVNCFTTSRVDTEVITWPQSLTQFLLFL